jgi:hypothetical protein
LVLLSIQKFEYLLDRSFELWILDQDLVDPKDRVVEQHAFFLLVDEVVEYDNYHLQLLNT